MHFWDAVTAFVFGAIVGSFLTVLIYRIPKGLNFIRPASRCGFCGFPLAAFDNIPILSFILLRGRCRRCGTGYGSRHVWIELGTGLLAMFLLHEWGLTFDAFFFFALGCLLIVISMIDIDYHIIPDSMTIAPWILGLFLAAVFDAKDTQWFVTFPQSLVGSVGGALSLWLVAYVYQVITGVEGLGLGDVKLIGFFGAFFGFSAVWVSIFVGSLSGVIVGMLYIVLRGKTRRTPIPFGPFLCLGLAAYLFDAHQWMWEKLF